MSTLTKKNVNLGCSNCLPVLKDLNIQCFNNKGEGVKNDLNCVSIVYGWCQQHSLVTNSNFPAAQTVIFKTDSAALQQDR